MRKSRALFLLLMLGWPLGVIACDGHTELEKSYCKLRGKGVVLPSMDDFRRNNPRVQYLLLKRPAQQAGINLPKPAWEASAARKPNPVADRPVSVQPASPKTSRRQHSTVSQVKSESASRRNAGLISECRLAARTIFCAEKAYELVDNLRNRELAADALLSANQLRLMSLRVLTGPAMTLNYQAYLEKMLLIGLGAATMSYSQFYYTWQAAEERGESAAQRFSVMYDFLKRDKISIAIERQFDERLPTSLNQCMRVSVALLVCDEGRRNWVYARL